MKQDDAMYIVTISGPGFSVTATTAGSAVEDAGDCDDDVEGDRGGV